MGLLHIGDDPDDDRHAHMGEDEAMNRCRRCGKDAAYFTDTFNPNTGKNDTFYLCEGCQRLLLMALRDFNSELGVWM